MKRTWLTNLILNKLKWFKPLYWHVYDKRVLLFNQQFNEIRLEMDLLFKKACSKDFKKEHEKLRNEIHILLNENDDIIQRFDKKSLDFYFKY